MRLLLSFVTLMIFATSLHAPPARAELSLGVQADAAYAAKDWPKVAELYRKIVDSHPDASSWYRLGFALVKLGRNYEAIALFTQAESQGLPKFYVEFGLALAYAASDRDKAFQHLQKAAANGFSLTHAMETEELLAPLRSDARFATILDDVRKNEMPCVHAAENRQFDFWIGEWNVVVSGTEAPQVGSSKIELILNQCVVLENWTSARSPYAGKSFNIYNTDLKRWEQYWVDNVGGNIFFHGILQNGVMDYWMDDMRQPDGKMLRRHLQFFKLDADTVRQFSQGSNDGGKTWFAEYDFTYHRTVPHSN